jgi:hypothetical protein
MTAPDPATAMHHSPALWGLLGAGAAAGLVLVTTAAWNLYDHRADVRRWLKF